MKFGVAIFPTREVQSPGEIARMAEDRGFECLLFPEHTHIPASRESAWPGGSELPAYYARTYDPFVACTAAAAATERLLIGTGICLVFMSSTRFSVLLLRRSHRLQQVVWHLLSNAHQVHTARWPHPPDAKIAGRVLRNCGHQIREPAFPAINCPSCSIGSGVRIPRPSSGTRASDSALPWRSLRRAARRHGLRKRPGDQSGIHFHCRAASRGTAGNRGCAARRRAGAGPG